MLNVFLFHFILDNETIIEVLIIQKCLPISNVPDGLNTENCMNGAWCEPLILRTRRLKAECCDMICLKKMLT